MDHLAVIDMLHHSSLMTHNDAEIMVINDDTDTLPITDKPADKRQSTDTTANATEQNCSNKKYHTIFKPKFSPIAHRLTKKN